MNSFFKKYWKCIPLLLMALMIAVDLDGRTRIIAIDGAWDGPETDSDGNSVETSRDRANTNLLNDFINAFRRYVPSAEVNRINSPDSLGRFFQNLNCKCGDTLQFVFSGHGAENGIYFSKFDSVITYVRIAQMIRDIVEECCCKINFIINACYSGAAIEPLSGVGHIKRVFTATASDTWSYSRWDHDNPDSVVNSYLRRLIRKINEIADSDDDSSFEDAIDEAHGEARDGVPLADWDRGEVPEGYRRDTINVRGHIRSVFSQRGRSGERRFFAVIEIDSPNWRRGQLDTIQLDGQEERQRLKKCRWVSTRIVYDRPNGIREKLGELIPINPPLDQRLNGHVMEIRRNRVKVHTTFPRHMFCREIWLDYPEAHRHPDSLLSVCKWIRQEVNITDPNRRATPVSPLRPFDMHRHALVHITRIERDSGIIEFDPRQPWIRRYRYRRARISDDQIRGLDTLIKDTIHIRPFNIRIVFPRPLRPCDNIWLNLKVLGSPDSTIRIVDGWVPQPWETGAASHTRLRDHNIDRSGTLESVLPSIYVLNKDRETYKGRIHLALYPLDEPPEDHTHSYTEELDVYQTLIRGSHFSPPDGESPGMDLSLLPTECLNWLYDCVFPPRVEQIEEKISSTLKAAFLMNYLKNLSQNQLREKVPNIERWKNIYLSDYSPPTTNHYSSQTARYYQLEFDYKNRISSDRAFSNALLMESASCDVRELAMELTELWEEASQSIDSDITFSEDELNGLEQYFSNYINGVMGHSPYSSELRCPDEDNCLNRILEHFKQLAINFPNQFSATTPDLTNIDLHKSLHQSQPDPAKTRDQSGMVPDFESSAIYTDFVDFYNLEPFESQKIRFNTISGLEPGRGYRLSFWRGDQIDDGDDKAINTSDLTYKYQDTLHLFFYLKKEDRCQCPDPSVLEIVSTATGRVSGKVFNLTVTNTGSEPVLCELGPYIVPPGRRTQGFILPEKMEVSLLPGETTTLQAFGHCLDFDKSPPREGSTGNPISDWIALDGNLSDADFSRFSPSGIIDSDKIQLLNPGTDKILNLRPASLNNIPRSQRTDYLKQLGELHLKAGAISRAAFDDFYYDNAINTPYGRGGHLQRYSVLQNLSWVYHSYLTGAEYRFEDFKKRSLDQVRETMPGLNLKDEKTMDELSRGLRSVWDASHKIGLDARLWK